MVGSEPKALVQLGNLCQEKRPMLVLDLADGGELYDYIAKQGRLSSEVCRFYAKQMVSAL